MAAPNRSSAGRTRASKFSSASQPGGNQQVMVLGGIGVAVVVLVIFMMSRPDDKKATPAAGDCPPVGANPVSAPAKVAPVSSKSKAGKVPARPAPSLTAEMLGKVRDLETKMKGFYNEGSTARTAGENQKAREKQQLAKGVLDEIDAMIKDQLLWQEEAQLSDWAQPAEYIELEKVYGSVMKLAKMVRMGGG